MASTPPCRKGEETGKKNGARRLSTGGSRRRQIGPRFQAAPAHRLLSAAESAAMVRRGKFDGIRLG
jgi:hypothetical protein